MLTSVFYVFQFVSLFSTHVQLLILLSAFNCPCSLLYVFTTLVALIMCKHVYNVIATQTAIKRFIKLKYKKIKVTTKTRSYNRLLSFETFRLGGRRRLVGWLGAGRRSAGPLCVRLVLRSRRFRQTARLVRSWFPGSFHGKTRQQIF